MPSSQTLRRVALALLLPLYTRSSSLSDIALLTFCATITTYLLVRFDNKPFHKDIAKAVGYGSVWCWCANRIADYIVLGEWGRLVFAYVVALDAMWAVLPEKLVGWHVVYSIPSSFRSRCYN